MGGWGTVSVDDDEWECKNGICLRFDGTRSPNVIAGENKYPGIYNLENLLSHRKDPGEHSAGFWRMVRSFPCPDADSNRIYNDADFIRGDAHGLVKWQTSPILCASLDPSFATGGDKAMATFGKIGVALNGPRTLQIDQQVELREDVRKKDEKKSLQIAKQFRDECLRRGILPENAAIDGSGGGMPFADLLTEIWSPRVLAVQFGGAASERQASLKDKRTAAQAYTNRVTELWFAGVDYVQSGQIKGLTEQAASEMRERRYDTIKGQSGLRLRAEPKTDMKARTGGKSPDAGDSFFIILELVRTRHGFMPVGMEGGRKRDNDSWQERTKRVNAVYSDVRYAEEAAA